jgi:hypothetical protein
MQRDCRRRSGERAGALATAAIAVLGALLHGVARASEEPLPVSLDYHAISTCPGESDFFEEVHMRAPRIRAALPGERAYGVRVNIAQKDNEPTSPSVEVAGEIVLLDLDGHKAIRRLEGSSCTDVARALALVVALDVAGVAFVPPARVEPPSPVIPQLLRERPSERARWLPAVVIHAGLRGGVAPRLTPVGALLFGLERDVPRLAAEFRVGASYAEGETEGMNDLVVLRLATMAFDGCVPRVQMFGDRVRLMPCARIETGVLLGEIRQGLGIAGGPWVASGLLGRVRASVAGNLFVEAEVSGLVPWLRIRFFEGDAKSPVFVTPSVTGGAALGAGMSFP